MTDRATQLLGSDGSEAGFCDEQCLSHKTAAFTVAVAHNCPTSGRLRGLLEKFNSERAAHVQPDQWHLHQRGPHVSMTHGSPPAKAIRRQPRHSDRVACRVVDFGRSNTARSVCVNLQAHNQIRSDKITNTSPMSPTQCEIAGTYDRHP